MTADFVKLTPLDIVMFRGNRLFAEAGHGTALMPPPPSVVAGALRSRILVDRGVDLGRFAREDHCDDPAVLKVLGTPAAPGSFRLAQLGLVAEGEPRFPLPADLVAFDDEVARLEPGEPGAAGDSSAPLPRVPILARSTRGKPRTGPWISGRGLARHLCGERVERADLIEPGALWASEPRIGIALTEVARTASDGMIYSTDAIRLRPEVSFFAGVCGAGELLPRGGLVRLGGDGRGAELAPYAPPDEVPWAVRPAPGDRGFRLVMATPGLFPDGWLPPGLDSERVLSIGSLRARLVCAAVGRAAVVSGWDLARGRPKPALRSVPAGSVYWFERESGDLGALDRLANDGLWPLLESAPDLESRRPEGFNHVWIGRW